MKLLLVFISFFQVLAAELTYDQYNIVANERKWPISNEAHEAFLGYCNNDTSPIPPEFKSIGLTRDDCEIFPRTSPSNESIYVLLRSNDCPAELTTTPLPNDQTTTIVQASIDKISSTEMASTTLVTTQKHDTTDVTAVKTTHSESPTTVSTITAYETDISLPVKTKSIHEETITSPTSIPPTRVSTSVTKIQLSEDKYAFIRDDDCLVKITTTTETSDYTVTLTLSNSETTLTTPVTTEHALSTAAEKSMESQKTITDVKSSSTSTQKESTTFDFSTDLTSTISQLPTSENTSTTSASTTTSTTKPTTTSAKITRTIPSSSPSTTTKTIGISSTKSTSPTTIPKTKSSVSSSTAFPPTSSTTITKVNSTQPPTSKTSPKTTTTTLSTTLPHITTEETTIVTDKPTTVTVSSTDKSSDVFHTSTSIPSTVTLASTTIDSTSIVASTSTEPRITTTAEGATSSNVKKSDTSSSSTATSTQSPTQAVVTSAQQQTQTTSSGERSNERETTTTSASVLTSESIYGQKTTDMDPTTSTIATTPIGNTETEESAVSATEAQTTTHQTTTEKAFDESRTTTRATKTSDVNVATTSTPTESFTPTSTSNFKTTTDKITEESSPTSTFSSTQLPEDTTLTQTELMPTDASTTKQSTTAESKMPSTATTTTTKSDTESSSSANVTASTTASSALSETDGSTSDGERIPNTTTSIEVKTTPGLEKTTSTQSTVPLPTAPTTTTIQKGSTEKATQETTLPAKAITSTTATSKTTQSTMEQTRNPGRLETTFHSTTATPSTPEPTTMVPKKSTKSTTTISESTTKSSPSSESTTESSSDPSTPPTTSSTSTTSTAQSPACKNACPSDFIEGQNACFKLLQPNTTDGWQFKDFENACTSQNGIIASKTDFGYTQNVKLFVDMSQNSKSFLVLTNAIPTQEYRRKKAVLAVDVAGLNLVEVPITALSIGEKLTNVSAICRIGKYCETYTCPIIEYFVPETSQYLQAAVPSTTVFKAGESLTLQCTVAPKRSFKVKCDPRGYLTPDSSMIKCGNEETIETESDGVVASCDQCDKFQTASCDKLSNGSYYCNCKELFFGKSCRFPLNACENFTCENEGRCMNRFTYAYCQCQTSYFGVFCQYNFYNSDEAWAMRFMVNTAAVAVIAEHVVRAKKRATPSINGKSGVLPTEISRFMALFFGTFAFLFRVMLEFPENDSPLEMASCADYFSVMITCVFFALTAMIGESIISLGIIQNQTTNQFRGQFRRRRNCVKPGKFYYLIAFFGFLAPVVLWQYSQYMVTPRSCVGVVPWPNMAPETQYAGVALVSILGIYALTGTALALLARFWINHQAYATRRRYDAEFADPWAYGKEVFPVEINVRYCLLAIRPTLFVICWCSFIITAEQMEWWATYLAIGCSCLYSVISCIQNFTTIADDLDSTIEFFMKRAPERWAPTYNYITLRTPDEYLQVKNLEKYRKNQEKKLNGGPAICYPIPFDQKIERLLRTSNPKISNPAALYTLIPTGLQNQVIKKWKKIYVKSRAEEKTPWDAMKEVWRDVHDTRPATLNITPESFVALFKNFKANMGHWDRFDHKDPIAKKIYERGAETLSIMPTYKIQTAEILKTNSTKQTATYFHGDPLLDFDAQQTAYNYLEKVCKSITAEDMAKDEFETPEFVDKCPDLCGRHRDILTAQVVNNHRWTLHDFLLDELRPNFIGPRSYKNQLAPGVTYLDDTAYYWMKVGEETWQRIQIQSKYESFNEAAHSEFNLWRGFLPWNLFKRYNDENYESVPDDAADFPNELDADEENYGPVPDDFMDFPNELNVNDNAKGDGDANDNAEQV